MKLPFVNARPAHSLLYITEAKTFRVDTDRRGVIQGDVEVIEFRCDTANGIPATLEHIINNSPVLGKKVWLLYVRLSTSLLNLPTIQVSGVEEEVLEQALLLVKPGGVIVMDDYYEDMPSESLDKWGCNRVLENSGLDYAVLPISDPVKGGGRTKMVLLEVAA